MKSQKSHGTDAIDFLSERFDKIVEVTYIFRKFSTSYLWRKTMQTKLTLRLEETLIQQAKAYAKHRGK